MCGIFAFLGRSKNLHLLLAYFDRIQHRGPDKTHIDQINDRVVFGFHRLAINGLTLSGDQPMTRGNVVLICNGEIYNHRELAKRFGFSMSSTSDCEIVLHLYALLGFEDTIKRLEGEFAMVLYDQNTDIMYAGRDRFGVRGLMYGPVQSGEFAFASEAIALSGLTSTINHFPPSCWWSSEHPGVFETYFRLPPLLPSGHHFANYENAVSRIRVLLERAVECRLLMTERPACCLLSGGLDSTVVSHLVAKINRAKCGDDRRINAYTIGLVGSDTRHAQGDLYYATIAADEFAMNHHRIYLVEKQVIDSVPIVVKTTGSPDVTTNRASIFNYNVCQEIKKIGGNSPDRDVVVFSAEFSDEIFNSYKGAMRAPDAEAFYRENRRMTDECHLYDFVRGDRCISSASLEARLPFTDTELVKFVMSLPPEFKMFREHGKEKMLLRDAFKGCISDVLLYRPKEAFSDATGSKSRPPYVILQEHADKLYTDEEFAAKSSGYKHLPPKTKEALWYREIFEQWYPGQAETLLKRYWQHAFASSASEDPSARTI